MGAVQNAPKVPSVYSYSSSSAAGEYRQWGYSISEDSNVIQWTKMELEPRAIVKELRVLRDLVQGLDLLNELRATRDLAINNDIPRYLPKDAWDVVREYLGKIAKEWYHYMRVNGRYTLENVPLDITITHPAVNLPFWRVTNALILIGSLSPGLMRPRIKFTEPSLGHFRRACFQSSEISLSPRNRKHVP